jgi:predicted nucleic acid-binding protein
MNLFFDTNVLVAASVRTHAHHTQALPALQRVIAKKDKGVITAHNIAELYSSLTRLPVVPRIHPVDAARIVADNLLPHFETIRIDKRDYLEAMELVRDGGWVGGSIYDAVLLRCAAKANVDRIYTFNLSHFRALAPPALQSKICAPS